MRQHQSTDRDGSKGNHFIGNNIDSERNTSEISALGASKKSSQLALLPIYELITRSGQCRGKTSELAIYVAPSATRRVLVRMKMPKS